MNQYPSNINNWLAAHVVFPFMNIGKIPGCFLQHKCSSSSCLLVRMPSCLANFSHHLLLGRDNSKVCWPLSAHTRLQHHAALLKGTACKSSNSIWSCWTPPAVGYFDVTAKSHFVYIDFGFFDCLEAESLTPPKTFFKQCLVVDGPALRENAMALDSLSEVSQSTAVPCTKISR